VQNTHDTSQAVYKKTCLGTTFTLAACGPDVGKKIRHTPVLKSKGDKGTLQPVPLIPFPYTFDERPAARPWSPSPTGAREQREQRSEGESQHGRRLVQAPVSEVMMYPAHNDPFPWGRRASGASNLAALVET